MHGSGALWETPVPSSQLSLFLKVLWSTLHFEWVNRA